MHSIPHPAPLSTLGLGMPKAFLGAGLLGSWALNSTSTRSDHSLSPRGRSASFAPNPKSSVTGTGI